jgi:hypothetical protein
MRDFNPVHQIGEAGLDDGIAKSFNLRAIILLFIPKWPGSPGVERLRL